MLDFVTQVRGLEASFRILNKVSGEDTPVWDFGVDGGTSEEISPKYTYETSGFYNVKLTVGEETVEHTVIVSDKSFTHLTDSIYNLFENYIPENLREYLTTESKAMYINKWQLYVHPLVNHCIPLSEYSNELYYEGLENQLILECAVFDYLYTSILNLLASSSASLQKLLNDNGTEEDSARGDRIKQITTGPTEVQYFDTLVETVSSLYKAYMTACSPGGVLDTLKQNLCMLSKRLDIYLPICGEPFKRVVPPKVVNRREEGPFGGPNSTTIIGGNGHALIPD